MNRIKVTFQDAKGNTIKTIEGNEGDDLLSLAHEHDVDLEGEFVWKCECETSSMRFHMFFNRKNLMTRS